MSGKPADESETSPVADDATEPEAAQAKQEPEGSTSESPGDGPQTSGASGEPEAPDASEQPGRAGKPGDLGKPGRSGAKGTSRRAMFTGAGLGAALAGLAGVAGGRAWEASQRPEEAILTVYPFRGDHQAGITTPAQDNMFTAAFDVSTTDVEELKTLLSDWAVAAEQMTSGELVGGQPSSNKQLPPRTPARPGATSPTA